ncbi:MAG: deoxyribodipyrimidine photo-lyase, partial [Methylobacterium sp.]|nr:deoxyribodipyrimidine photo-lyase [Methylobacterium sp.]
MPSSFPAPAIHWFRNDLRLDDNPALRLAGEAGAMLAIFIDETDEGLRPRGGAQGWFLHHALARLAESLREKGSDLIILRGNSREIVPQVAGA